MSEDEEDDMQTAKVIDFELNATVQRTLDEGVPERFSKLVDENLKKAFGDTVEEEIPDRFRDLLAQLQKATDEKSE